MKTIILLLWISSGDAGAGMSAEFASFEACEAAAKAVTKKASWIQNPRWVCVTKGEGAQQ